MSDSKRDPSRELAIDPAFWRGKRVLLTGHTGFKGSWLTHWLARLGAEVTGLALEPEGERNLFEAAATDAACEHRVQDIRDLAGLERVFAERRPELVFHLAAQSLVRRSYDIPVETFDVNVMGTVKLLDAARRAPEPPGAVVIVTSDKCYENRSTFWGYREHDPMGGYDPYSASKGMAELATSAMRRSFCPPEGRMQVASARAGNVIGGGDFAVDRIVPDIVRALDRGAPVHIRNPLAVRPWQHVLEPLGGYLQLARGLFERPGDYLGGWNFGPEPSSLVNVQALVDAFIATWGSGSYEHAEGGGRHEASLLNLDWTKAQQLLGWSPRLDFEHTIAWTADFYRRQLAPGAEVGALIREQIDRYMELTRTSA